ncbi:hypothetical protein C6496_14980 [Candidatus Poribacteria bacterium]|nr:MAG: hypothetical protein C6496_14980 [Candidatus Poribacteria bacterium]
MKMKNLKSHISDFLNSEDGRVGVKAPLVVGVAAGGLMLAHTLTSTQSVHAAGCGEGPPCDPGHQCVAVPVTHTLWVWDPDVGEHVKKYIPGERHVCRPS